MFPGMNPFLESPSLWEGVHTRLVVAFANQLQPALDDRYVASVEERVYIEGPAQRIPDVWISRTAAEKSGSGAFQTTAVLAPGSDAAIVAEVEDLEIHQKFIEILDAYDGMRVVTIIELLSPSNKRPGIGQQSYRDKQQRILESDCNLVEIDLLRSEPRTLSIPQWKLDQLEPFDYITCVNRSQLRKRFELYPTTLQQRLPRVAVPVSAGDSDVVLDLQSALQQVIQEGRYDKRVNYDRPCDPPLAAKDDAWLRERIANR
jgi:hypothetical protein